jgi:hypothetical protein
MKKYARFIKNIFILVVILALGYFLYNYFFKEEEDRFSLESTPLHIERIRSIAEISTISYKDEVVVDTVEYYEGTNEMVSGNLNKMTSLDNWKYGVRPSSVKRRLTLIVKGEVRYGFNLTEKNVVVQHNEDTIWVNLPKPKIIDVLVVPSQTEVFLENGTWGDAARVKLEKRAINRLKWNASKLDLEKKASTQMDKLLRAIIPKDRKVLIYFSNENS